MRELTQTANARHLQASGRIASIVLSRFAILRLPSELILADKRPVIIAGNHRSLLDVFCAAAICHNIDRSARFLIQRRYFDAPIVGRWLSGIGAIPLSAANKDEAFTEALSALSRGEIVGIMPEGRLVPADERTGQTGDPRPGVGELARRSGAAVMPLAFHNTDIVWPRGGLPRLRFRRPVVTLKFGSPVALTGSDDLEDAERVMQALDLLLHDADTQAAI